MSDTSRWTQAPNLSDFTSDYVILQAGRRVYPDPTGNIRPMGLIYTLTSSSSLATGTAEQTLGTYTVPANIFDQSGRKIRVRAFFITAANTHSKICQLYFDSQSITTGAITTSAATAMLELTITADTTTGRSRVWGWGLGGTDGTVPVKTVGAIVGSWGVAVEIKATGQTGTSGVADITLTDFSIEYMN